MKKRLRQYNLFKFTSILSATFIVCTGYQVLGVKLIRTLVISSPQSVYLDLERTGR